MTLYSVVVPVYPPHFRFLPDLVGQLDRSIVISNYNLEIIICASEVTIGDQTLLNGLECKYPLTILPSTSRQNAAENRNRGWDIAKGKYIFFMDADDLYHPYRFQFMINYLEHHPDTNLLCHSYLWLNETSPEWYNYHFDQVDTTNYEITSQMLYSYTFPNGRGQEDGNLICPGKRIHHAMVAVKRELKINQNESCPYLRYDEQLHLERKEDGKLCKDMLWKYGNVTFIDIPLMVYRP
jgi:glycosyltransferase involved in cell wall biosynthesis